MKKIANITLNGYKNYGNRLQNFAVQKIIEDLGCEIETIIIESKTENSINNKKNYKSKIKFKKIFNKINYIINKKYHNKRIDRIKKFSQIYIKETTYSINLKQIPADLNEKYDYFIVGSDQVWNPKAVKEIELYFLTFADKSKRIAYAPSFGVAEIEEEYKENYKKWIGQMNHLSVREIAGAQLIRTLTGREATVLIDPTMMLTKEHWQAISKPSVFKPKQKYLLTYFLGEISRENKKNINDLANRYKLIIVNLADIRDKQAYITDPGEFIDYIESAEVFCTDSFHGCVFSILMETPFVVFERAGSQSMYSRIDTLLSKFKLENRKIEYIVNDNQLFEKNYEHIPMILEQERKKVKEYLMKALEISDEVVDEK